MRDEHDLTGNDYVSISSIGTDGAMDGITVLHAGMAGLVGWAGDSTAPLLKPTIRIDGAVLDLQRATWRRLDRWLPSFALRLEDGSQLSGVICAPLGYPAARGFMLRVEFENRARVARAVTVDLDVAWSWSRLWIGSGRPLAGPNTTLVRDDVLILESGAGSGPSLAILADPPRSGTAPGTAAPPPAAEQGTAAASAANGTRVERTLSVKFDTPPNSRRGTAFYVGAGRERDGARAAALQMRRNGAEAWLRQTRLELSQTLRAAQSNRWSDALNRNLLFNRYFAAGRAIDDDRLHLVRSRSPRCPSPALFNEREALFWTLPALILADPGVAREALLRTLETFSERSGEHTRYLDGGAFDAGFVFDQFLLYPWLIDTYVTSTGDRSLLDEPIARQIVFETDAGAFMRLHPRHVLGSTDLLPSGEPADYPYAAVANAVLYAFCSALDRLPWPQLPREQAAAAPEEAPDEAGPRMAGAAAEVSAAVWRHCVTEVDGQPMLAASADLAGKAAIYDDPSMSLALLPLFGICTSSDPVWLATMEFLRSPQYPLWRDGRVPGLAGRSEPDRAEFAALCADLHGPRPDDALERLLHVALPAGVAARSYDPETGAAADPHHAALAGFLAWSLVRTTEKPARREVARKRPR